MGCLKLATSPKPILNIVHRAEQPDYEPVLTVVHRKEERQFGAWGEVDEFKQDGIIKDFSESILPRGFTGHEHFSEVALIHMNGRMYDPQTHRFLSPDNNIQDPYNTMSYDRFGYVWNNPLMNTDPSGEFVFFAAAIGALLGGISAAVNGGDFGDILLGAIIGGIVAGVGAGISNLAAQGLGFVSTGGATAGFFGNAALSVTGFTSGLVVGAASGFVAGFTGEGGLSKDQGLGEALMGGLRAGVTSAVLAGLTAGTGAGIRAHKAGGDFWSRIPRPKVKSVLEGINTELSPTHFNTSTSQGDLSGLTELKESITPNTSGFATIELDEVVLTKYSVMVNGRDLNPGNFTLSNPALRTGIINLYTGIVNDLGHSNFEFEVTGGGRYHSNGSNYSSTNDSLISTGNPTAHNVERGARAVDLRIRYNNGTNFDHSSIQSIIENTGNDLFYQSPYFPSFYGDGHHHLQLPNRINFWAN